MSGFKRTDRRRWLIAGGWLLLVVLGFWCLGSGNEPVVAEETRLTLWTPGAPETLESRARPVVALASLGGRPPAEARVLADAEALRAAYPCLEHVEVIGAGLEPSELPALAGVAMAFTPGERGRALVREVRAPSRIAVGERVVVTGTVGGLGDGKVAVLTLEAPNGEATRQEVVGMGGRGAFRLDGGRPVSAGTYLWQLRCGGQTVPVGVEVVAAVRPRVLLLASRPSFEVGRLQRWLGETGAPVALRTRVSADRVRVASANGAEVPGDLITTAALNAVDLVVADRAALRALSSTEQAALESVVREGGLGLLELADANTTPETIPLSPWGLVNEGGNTEGREARLRWADDQEAALAAALPPAEWKPEAGDERMLRDGQDRVVAVSRRLGRGWVAATLVKDTWRWPQGGRTDGYAAYWSGWIQRLARPQEPQAAWEISGAGDLLVEDRPVRVRWRPGRADERVPTTALIGVARRDAETMDLVAAGATGEATGRYWPRESGWHRVRTMDGAVERSFYVHTWSEVESLLRAARTNATAMHAARRSVDASVGDTRVMGARRGGLVWWLAGGLLAVWGVLWWRERDERF